MIGRPDTSELDEYQNAYVSNVRGDNIVAFLQQQLEEASRLLASLPEEKGSYRYGLDKWSIKELVGHMSDSERVFAYRTLAFSRNDSNALPGFDQDVWAKNANHLNVPLRDVVAEFENVRRSTLDLLRQFDAAAWTRRGTANNKPISVHALTFLIGGHAEHHLQILKSRYL